MLKTLVTFLILGLAQTAAAKIDAEMVTGTWIGPGVAKSGGKVVCPDALITWKITLDEDLLNLVPSVLCQSTGVKTDSSPVLARLNKNGTVDLMLSKKVRLPFSSGTHTDDTVIATFNVGVSKVSAKIGPMRNGKTEIAVTNATAFQPNFEINGTLTKQ